MSDDDKSKKTIMGMGPPRPESAGLGTDDTLVGAPEAPAPAPARGEADLIGVELSGYRIERRLAEGGMGVVYVAEHTKIGKTAALKMLKLEYCRDDTAARRFYQEARAVNEIRHENIVEIYDFGRDPDGRVYFVMELLEGESLDARLEREPLGFAETLSIVEQIGRALKAAHAKGFVHRDLKPENIWLKPSPDGVVVKLLDFGIAKLVGMDNAEDKLTRTGSIIGTPHYMSPEQINGSESIDHRSDIYSLGVILYEIASGKRPFAGPTLQAIIAGHVLHDVPPMAELRGGTPPEVEAVVGRMLAKSPDDRYRSVEDVVADLGAIAADRPPDRLTTLDRDRPIAPAATAEREAPPRKRSPIMWIAAAIAVLGAGAGGFYLATRGDDEARGGAVTDQPRADAAPDEPAEPPLDLEELRKSSRALIRGSLEAAEPGVRAGAADAVADVRDRDSEGKLVELTGGDPDAEVRGHAAVSLGKLGVDSAAAKLAELHDDAEPRLATWYAEALARLDHRAGRRSLEKHARARDLPVAFKAALALADLSEPGDRAAIAALKKLAAREAELNDIAPYAGVALLSRLARLGFDPARDALGAALESDDEAARLAAAEALARIGDESGKPVLTATFDDASSPNRAVAAAALIELGDYRGFELLSERLEADRPGARRLAARALGAIGERDSLRPLVALHADADAMVKLAAAVAVLRILGLDPLVLAQASVDWATSALDSDDWAVREAAASTLGDIPETRAVPLLAAAIADPDPKVRRAAARSASKMSGETASATVAKAALAETDNSVKEQQVRALASIGQPAARDALVEIAGTDDRVGVIAVGSLVAVGDKAAAPRLETAAADRRPSIRMAAVEAAVVADDPVVLPTLKLTVADRVFEVRFAASEGLAHYRQERDAAMPVLEQALARRDVALRSRAQAAMLRFGVTPPGFEPKQLLASGDLEERLAALGVIKALDWQSARPLLRLAANDGDARIKRAAIDAVRPFEQDNRAGVVRFYKGFVDDLDEVVGNRVRGRLAELIERPKTASAPAPAPAPTPASPAPDLDGVRGAVTAATEARAAHDRAARAVEAVAAEIEAATNKPAAAEDDIDAVEKLGGKLDRAVAALARQRSELSRAVKEVVDAAAAISGADTSALVAEANKAGDVESAAAVLAKKVADRETAIKRYVKSETADPAVYLAAADAAIATGKLASARRDLLKAEKIYKQRGRVDPQLYFSKGRLYDKMAIRESDKARQINHFKQARANYDRFAGRGSGRRHAQAKARSAEIAEELESLEGSP
jgi:serine/threonine-protein kinase